MIQVLKNTASSTQSRQIMSGYERFDRGIQLRKTRMCRTRDRTFSFQFRSVHSVRTAPKIFSIGFCCRRFLLYIEGKMSRRINGTTSLKRRGLSAGRCSVPVDSPNVPKSTCGHFRRFKHFKQLLRSSFEVKKKKDSMKGSNKMRLVRFLYEYVLVRP